MFGPKGPFCQSCGMPLGKDTGGGGTEADGSKSADYCSHCYQSGKFTEPNLSIDQMRQKVIGRMKEMHIPGFLAERMTGNLPTLKRWTIESHQA